MVAAKLRLTNIQKIRRNIRYRVHLTAAGSFGLLMRRTSTHPLLIIRLNVEHQIFCSSTYTIPTFIRTTLVLLFAFRNDCKLHVADNLGLLLTLSTRPVEVLVGATGRCKVKQNNNQ